jgi:PncC family amidohydrolase
MISDLLTLADFLQAQRLTLATAESCTGGLLGSWLTDQPGASNYYLGGVIAYHNLVKQQLLGVPAATLATAGAVSAECALAMAQGVHDLLRANCAIAITGIAGPGGGSVAKPVGLVWVAVISPKRQQVQSYQWQHDRLTHKKLAAQAGIQMLLTLLHGSNQ